MYAALRGGASGFLLKDAPADQLLAFLAWTLVLSIRLTLRPSAPEPSTEPAVTVAVA